MEDENSLRQCGEIEALSAIYSEEFKVVDEASKKYSIKFSNQSSVKVLEIALHFTFTQSYPTGGPPIYELRAPWLKGAARQDLQNLLENIYLENIGEDIIFLWAECVRDFLADAGTASDTGNNEKMNKVEESTKEILNMTECPAILHGETITDRKSTFQAHLAKVQSLNEVNAVKQSLMQHKKIANATHNIVAYRVRNKQGALMQDCEDDGETAAGGRLLHLLQILDVTDIIVIVSRWYGGIHLGPDRFKHINNAARSILQQEGFLSSHTKTKKK